MNNNADDENHHSRYIHTHIKLWRHCNPTEIHPSESIGTSVFQCCSHQTCTPFNSGVKINALLCLVGYIQQAFKKHRPRLMLEKSLKRLHVTATVNGYSSLCSWKSLMSRTSPLYCLWRCLIKNILKVWKIVLIGIRAFLKGLI